METYVVCGPLFYFDRATEFIGARDKNGVTLPVPHAYFKSILTENDRGTLDLWSFILPNEESDKPLDSFLIPTIKIEQYSGINLWNRLRGSSIARKKRRQKRRMFGKGIEIPDDTFDGFELVDPGSVEIIIDDLENLDLVNWT